MTVLLATVLLPGALFCYITGQVSPLVGLAALLVAWEASSQHPRPALIAAGLLVITLKPHIVAFPVLLCGLELLRKREFKPLLWSALGLVLAALFAFSTTQNWPVERLSAWQSGDFRGGKPGLVSPGYMGLSDLGIPTWVFILFAVYILNLWRTRGLDRQVIALSFAAGLLLVPYNRSYDYVLLIYPVLALVADLRKSGWLAAGLGLIGAFGLPWTQLSLLSPVVVALGTMIAQARYENRLD